MNDVRDAGKGVKGVNDPQTRQLLENEIKELIIPASQVAHVQLNNSLEHALLVLIKSGYSAIPVLDKEYKICGQISKTLILESILGMERIEYETLHEHQVVEVMNSKIPRMKDSDTFLRALELSINHPFVCIEDDAGRFVGILTRKSILAIVYRYFRNKKTT
ncbi:CBS domain-containing protein [Brevibacillus humidisoli]|uniref:cyclic-di-AMP-binding protein CbpB n=1 Tax=Brevibacillus humidisoli TaxID=2895522 RepID=UPI001E6471C8|nr:cyclic-di-AMP-binding protein CbpB [Brevibacillus humidisoli]UFJ42223.1 CBS domain-containing protein [Brevibacillus humidisoli]